MIYYFDGNSPKWLNGIVIVKYYLLNRYAKVV